MNISIQYASETDASQLFHVLNLLEQTKIACFSSQPGKEIKIINKLYSVYSNTRCSIDTGHLKTFAT